MSTRFIAEVITVSGAKELWSVSTPIAEILGEIFQKAACIEGFEINKFAQEFAKSEIAHAIEYGNVEYLMSEKIGEDITNLICSESEFDIEDVNKSNVQEYWVGYI